MASGLWMAAVVWGAASLSAVAAEAERGLSRVLLTWQRDPTSTMTIQWIEPGQPLPLLPGQSDDRPMPRIPHVEPVELDGVAEAWRDRALHVAFLADEGHRVPQHDDLHADAWLAWNDQGLLLAVDVTDDHAVEHPRNDRLWNGDGVELFVSAGLGSPQRYQLVVSPGVDPEQPAPRHHFYDYRADKSHGELAVSYKVVADGQRYRLEALLPWANLGLEPQRGGQAAFQIYINDRDAPRQPVRGIAWHPRRAASQDPSAMVAVTLAPGGGSPAPVAARLDAAPLAERGVVEVIGLPELVGRPVTIRATDQELASATFQSDGPMARAEVTLPEPPAGQRWGALHAWAGDQYLASAPLPLALSQSPATPAELTWFRQGDDEHHRVSTDAAPLAAWPGMYRQRVELTGLDPDTAYRFRTDRSSRELGFRTMPATLDQPLRFAIGGDTRHRRSWMEQTSRAVMAHQPRFIVWGGDLAYANGLPEMVDRWAEWFDANDATLIDDDGFVTPVIVGIGNHEVQGGYHHTHPEFEPTDAWRQRIAPFFFDFFAFPGHPGYNLLDFGDYLSLIILDTDHAGPMLGEQTDWLDAALAARRDVPHVFPVYHVPAYPSHRDYASHTSQKIRMHWVPLFEQHGIQLAFENHDHAYKRTHPLREGRFDPQQGIIYLGDGAWGVETRPVHDVADAWYLRRAESVRHAILITLDGSHRHVQVVREDGAIIDEYPEPEAPSHEHEEE